MRLKIKGKRRSKKNGMVDSKLLGPVISNVSLLYQLIVCTYNHVVHVMYSDIRTAINALNPCHTRVVFWRRSNKMQNAKVNAVRTPWTPWQLHRTPWEILEHRGSAFLLDMLKTNAITQRSNKSAVRTPWQRSENFINAA